MEAGVVAEWVVAHLVRVEWSSSHSYLSTLKGFDLAALNAGKEDAVMITAANSNAHDSQRKRQRVSDKPTIRPSGLGDRSYTPDFESEPNPLDL